MLNLEKEMKNAIQTLYSVAQDFKETLESKAMQRGEGSQSASNKGTQDSLSQLSNAARNDPPSQRKDSQNRNTEKEPSSSSHQSNSQNDRSTEKASSQKKEQSFSLSNKSTESVPVSQSQKRRAETVAEMPGKGAGQRDSEGLQGKADRYLSNAAGDLKVDAQTEEEKFLKNGNAESAAMCKDKTQIKTPNTVSPREFSAQPENSELAERTANRQRRADGHQQTGNKQTTANRQAPCTKEGEGHCEKGRGDRQWQKSPEQGGSKLQLARHAAKRRRYTEAWNPAPKKKLFKSKATAVLTTALSSADETIDPRLLDCTIGNETELLAGADAPFSRKKRTNDDDDPCPPRKSSGLCSQSINKQGTLCSQLNASLDPALRLTQYLQESAPADTLTNDDDLHPSCAPPEKEEEEEIGEHQDQSSEDGDVTLDPRFLHLHQTSGQDITMISISSTESESQSGWATPSPLEPAPDSTPLEAAPTTTPTASSTILPVSKEAGRASGAVVESLEDSFDRVPEKKAPTSYAFNQVVRKQAERRKLRAFSCADCEKYYNTMGLAEDEVSHRMAHCSRHRAKHARPSTPEDFWSIGFPDTQECQQRGQPSSDRKQQR